jgi:hypothetical protein
LAGNLSDLNCRGTCTARGISPSPIRPIDSELSNNAVIHNPYTRTAGAGTRNSHSQAALFVGIEVNLLAFFKDDANYHRSTTSSARHALLIFTYSALFFSLSAAISGLILTDEFGALPVRASRKPDPIQQGVFDSSALDLLQSYGAKRSWIWVMWHCESFLPSFCKTLRPPRGPRLPLPPTQKNVYTPPH